MNISPTYVGMLTIKIRSYKKLCKEVLGTSIPFAGSIIQKKYSKTYSKEKIMIEESSKKNPSETTKNIGTNLVKQNK